MSKLDCDCNVALISTYVRSVFLNIGLSTPTVLKNFEMGLELQLGLYYIWSLTLTQRHCEGGKRNSIFKFFFFFL